jgi:hypothetical protein
VRSRAPGCTAWRKKECGTIGFGSTYDMHRRGARSFAYHPFPVRDEEHLPTPSRLLGRGYARMLFEACSIVNVSGTNFGATSVPAVRSLSRGMKRFTFTLCQ